MSEWKIGYQTITLGRRPSLADFTELFALLQKHHFHGVEIAQSPSDLPMEAHQLVTLLRHFGLALIGLSGGSVQERSRLITEMKACDVEPRACVPYPYLYVESFDTKRQNGHGVPYPLALHASVYKEVQHLAKVRGFLYGHKELLWLPDTAHLYLAGEDPVMAFGDPTKPPGLFTTRMVGVHLKDWTPKFGRWSHRYARGFTVLGSGTVPLDDVVRRLKTCDWSQRIQRLDPLPWIVVELDYPSTSIQECIESSADWLAKHELLPPSGTGNHNHGVPRPPARVVPSSNSGKPDSPVSVLASLQDTASLSPDWFYVHVIRVLSNAVRAKRGVLSAVSPSHGLLSVLANYPYDLEVASDESPIEETLAQVSVERQSVSIFDLESGDPGARYGRGGLKPLYDGTWREGASNGGTADPRYGARYLVELPIFNSFNPSHVRILAQFLCEGQPDSGQIDNLVRIGDEAARVGDAWLNDRCLTAVAEVELLAGQAKSSQQLLDDIAKELIPKDAIRCEACTILLADLAGKRLDVSATTGIEWNPPLDQQLDQQFYSKGDGTVTGRMLDDPSPRIFAQAIKKGAGRKSHERRVSDDVDTLLLAPMLDTEKNLVGVIRCVNKISQASSQATHFSDDDLAIIDAIAQAAVPHIRRLVDAERSEAHLERLKHEFKNPLVGIRANLSRIRRVVEPLTKDHPEIRMEFLEDAMAWSELLGTMLEGLGDTVVPAEREATKLFGDVVMPVIRQLSAAARARGFDSKKITYGEIHEFPADLLVARLRLQQVFFNLVDNAIKYAQRDPEKFAVKIACSRDDGKRCWNVAVEDYGQGVEDGWQEEIFRSMVRGPNAARMAVAGKGIGLAVAREIAAEHGGNVVLTSHRNPTVFTVQLPYSLRPTRNPSSPSGVRG